jgi:hypothetical protein
VICKVYLPSYYHTSFEEYFKVGQALFFYFMPISFRFPESRHVAGGIQNFISIFWVTHQTEHTLSSDIVEK